jgi:hypothetical protein
VKVLVVLKKNSSRGIYFRLLKKMREKRERDDVRREAGKNLGHVTVTLFFK